VVVGDFNGFGFAVSVGDVARGGDYWTPRFGSCPWGKVTDTQREIRKGRLKMRAEG
jgi:hypothetical protein